jgi:NADH:ubiquinone oxidoreductase subunit C
MLQGMPHLFLVNKTFRTKGLSLLIPDNLLYFLALHIKLSSPAKSSQLIEIFAYENPVMPSTEHFYARPSNSLLVYQFHNLFSQERLFVFATSLKSSRFSTPKSLGELFSCSAWLEREAGEMHGICFEGKKDLRNLMLQYGDASAPFRKSYPSIGVKEIFYDSVTDTLVQVPVSLQI